MVRAVGRRAGKDTTPTDALLSGQEEYQLAFESLSGFTTSSGDGGTVSVTDSGLKVNTSGGTAGPFASAERGSPIQLAKASGRRIAKFTFRIDCTSPENISDGIEVRTLGSTGPGIRVLSEVDAPLVADARYDTTWREQQLAPGPASDQVFQYAGSVTVDLDPAADQVAVSARLATDAGDQDRKVAAEFDGIPDGYGGDLLYASIYDSGFGADATLWVPTFRVVFPDGVDHGDPDEPTGGGGLR